MRKKDENEKAELVQVYIYSTAEVYWWLAEAALLLTACQQVKFIYTITSLTRFLEN